MTIVNETQLSIKEHYYNIFSFLKCYAHLWRNIGNELGFLPNELSVIESNPILMTQNPPVSYLSKMLELWLQWAPSDGRGSKNFATFEDLQAALLRVNDIAAEAYNLQSVLGIFIFQFELS